MNLIAKLEQEEIERLGKTAAFRNGKFVVPCRLSVKNQGKVAANRLRVEVRFDW